MKSKTLALFLKSARVKAGVSQLEVAKTLGYNNSQFVSNWERGVSAPPLKVLKKLIHLYKLEREEVIEIILTDTRIYLETSLNCTKHPK